MRASIAGSGQSLDGESSAASMSAGATRAILGGLLAGSAGDWDCHTRASAFRRLRPTSTAATSRTGGLRCSRRTRTGSTPIGTASAATAVDSPLRHLFRSPSSSLHETESPSRYHGRRWSSRSFPRRTIWTTSASPARWTSSGTRVTPVRNHKRRICLGPLCGIGRIAPEALSSSVWLDIPERK